MTKDFGFEKVLIELDWYDGPRGGVAEVCGILCRFKSNFDEKDDDWLGTFLVWPISEESFALELEAWSIFVSWNKLFESGKAGTKPHPGTGGINIRYDEIVSLLQKERETIPSNCDLAIAEFLRIERDARYEVSGPDYKLKWQLLD